MARSPEPPSNALVEELAAALVGLGLTRVGSLAEMQAHSRTAGAAVPVFLVDPRLRIAHHFDLDADMLVYDPVLGTAGLVFRVGDDPGQLAGEIQAAIDRATYLRHLLLTDPVLGSRLPLTVELVLLGRDDPEQLRKIGRELGHAVRETAFLEAVGVNFLLPREGAERFPRADLRRAFPWLLLATRAWYGSRPDGDWFSPANQLTAIEIQDYRLPGRRKLALLPPRVHLIFGRNGSGKSALVEAIEGAVTGTAERLAGGVDYDEVIRNRASSEPARVTLHFADGHTTVHQVESAGISNPLRRDLRATAFRLNQPVMDRLSSAGDAQRAATFDSFFAAENADLIVYERARESADKALEQVPAAIRDQLIAGRSEGEDLEEAVLRQLAWLDDPKSRLTPDVATACLPLPDATIAALVTLSPELAQLHISWGQGQPALSEAAATLGRIDEALERLRTSLRSTVETLRIARGGLQRVQGWQAAGGMAPSRDFLADLNDWLRRCALAALSEQYCQLLEILAEARQGGWEPDAGTAGPFAQAPASAADLAAHRQQAADWARERDELFQRVMAAPVSGGGGRAPTPSAEIVRPSPAQLKQLDAAGRWLLPPSPSEPKAPLLLGQAIDQALTADSTIQVGPIAVGSSGWAETLLTRLGRLEDACRELEGAGAPGGGRNLQALFDARASSQAARDAGAKLGQSFLRQLRGNPGSRGGGDLIAALNELMALFTPARWAYEDIGLEYRRGASGNMELFFRIGSSGLVQAALRLNSAQLNLFTVALFLLCAVRADNPLGLLVLDDPLQNMDELTATTLARSLAKLERLWGRRWQLLLFFHGQEHRERFRQEIPLASYQLPWLSPGDGASGEPIESLGELYTGGLQSLTGIVEARPDGGESL